MAFMSRRWRRRKQRRSGSASSFRRPAHPDRERSPRRERAGGEGHLAGNVSVVQGKTMMKAGKMTVFYVKQGDSKAPSTSSNIERLEVDGKVYLKSETQVATGDRGTFDMKTEVLTLSGEKVVLSEGKNVLTGCKLTVQMKTGEAKFEACGGRIKTLLTPGLQG
jgi:lipopolysaccharide export system protein LptA